METTNVGMVVIVEEKRMTLSEFMSIRNSQSSSAHNKAKYLVDNGYVNCGITQLAMEIYMKGEYESK